MWQLVIFNAAWFLTLFAVHFIHKKSWKAVFFPMIFLVAFLAVLQKTVDPIAWLTYVAFSLLTLWGGLQFRHWVYAKWVVLDDETQTASKKLKTAAELLRQRSEETEVINQKASDIYYAYDKIREMSQSLDKFETFLIFGEALARQHRFQVVTLALFDEEGKESRIPQEITRLSREDFKGPFDKAYFLKHKKQFEIGATPFLCKIFEMIFQNREPLSVTDVEDNSSGRSLKTDPEYEAFVAYPILMGKKIFGILIISGIQNDLSPALPILCERFLAEMERVKLYEKVETLAITDGLTGAHVRRHLLERLEGEISRSRKFGFDLSFLMIDVDHFKRFNDQYGHLVGDVVLKQTAETIKKSVRELDLVGRYGGEEFAVLLVETDRMGASYVAERIRSAIEERNFKAYDENLKATVSIGCATFPKAETEAQWVLETADRALYEAKHQGRNRVCLAP